MVKEHPSIESNKRDNTKKMSLNTHSCGDFRRLKWPIKRYVFLNSELMLDYNISQLPPNLKYRIYIRCMREFWKNYVPLTAKPPTWYYHAVEQQAMLLMGIQLNIHFMHLPCNTLEKNKKYIIGCQCKSCLKSDDRRTELIKHERNPNYYVSTQLKTYSKWNDEIEHFDIGGNIVKGLFIFDPDIDVYETLEDKINGPPIYFEQDNYIINPDNV